MKTQKYYLLSLLFLLQANCNNTLIYHPSKKLYHKPDKLKLKYETVNLKGSDGNFIHAWYFPSISPKPKATIVQFHGNAGNITSHYLSLVWLIEAGYNFFTFDYRGYGLSEGSPNTESILSDMKIVLQWLQEKSLRDGVPLILYGQSLGGVLVIHSYYNMNNIQNIAGLVIEGSFTSFHAMGNFTLNQTLFPPIGCLSRVFLSNRYNTHDIIPKLKRIPIVVIHGEKDTVVPVQFGKEIYQLAKEPKELWVVPQGYHLIRWYGPDAKERRIKLLDILNRVFKRYEKH